MLKHSDVVDLIDKMVFRDWEFYPMVSHSPQFASFLEIRMPIMRREWDRTTRDEIYVAPEKYRVGFDWLTVTWNVSAFMELDEVPRELLRFINKLSAHEVQENFYVDGKRVFDPHVIGEFLSPI